MPRRPGMVGTSKWSYAVAWRTYQSLGYWNNRRSGWCYQKLERWSGSCFSRFPSHQSSLGFFNFFQVFFSQQNENKKKTRRTVAEEIWECNHGTVTRWDGDILSYKQNLIDTLDVDVEMAQSADNHNQMSLKTEMSKAAQPEVSTF